MPGSSPTMERREPVRRLKRVDLPTLGRPTIANTGASLVCVVSLALFFAFFFAVDFCNLGSPIFSGLRRESENLKRDSSCPLKILQSLSRLQAQRISSTS